MKKKIVKILHFLKVTVQVDIVNKIVMNIQMNNLH